MLAIEYANLKVVLVVAEIGVEESVSKSGRCYILRFSRLWSLFDLCFFQQLYQPHFKFSKTFDEEELSSRVRCAFCNVWFHNLLLMLP